MATATETFTELLRHPKDVVARTENGAVRITRRDADDLILMRAGDLEDKEAGIALASALMRAVMRADGNIATALSALHPWILALPAEDQHQCATEIGHLLWSSVELGSYRRLLEEFDAWRGTAEAHASGMRAITDFEWFRQDGPRVARPE
ncbi:MAG TPA: hypothetical protein PK331_14330 [Gordonia sp. (in: high G+C Gram-positive bacteria)]|uniref:hypothetical protein n=1 Tax=unclassified Gordonia (in: high G+C Gram-positive bacteria) TaxID=2657482 RepID=UPI000FAB5FF3|nr:MULTISPECIES: hypothetical protein [unclassified Gordonia (in: high G+C Gram-positive bacteria)]RUP37244.1 MAG: hypothetical protein EKK60_12960 [Gordonia sp. (in: high G+C Gram-positive bacteria)]HNP56264.1 hypothetical protein [Gordonia sp. (in: high G+C Gram-positive bacteria)]HRC52084.1 hypothetical protein [Gordonia sp. (in: high G+C Gram-positive bacteria)]